MDLQTAFNIVIGVAAFLGGYIVNRITTLLDRLDKDVREMPLKYVTRIDFQRDIDELKELCREISKKLDHKADK